MPRLGTVAGIRPLLPLDLKPHTFSVPSSAKSISCNSYSSVGIQHQNLQARCLRTKALDNSDQGQIRVGPLQFESPAGQLLLQILLSHPHLLPATVDQQLESLQADKDDQKKRASQDLLYKRIAEVKDKERQTAVEEIMYCLIVRKFMEYDITMIPPLTQTFDTASYIDFLPNQEEKLERVHSPDAFELIQSHLMLVLEGRTVGSLTAVVDISKIKLGKLYAASIMYGYFLKRVDERFQLEKNMNMLPPTNKQELIVDDLKPNPFWDWNSMVQISPDDDVIFNKDDEESGSSRLRSYVAYLDAETLQRYTTIRSAEAISLIEKQTQALFGQPDIKVTDDGTLEALNDQIVSVSLSGLTMLVLEAAAFGSFLWDAESYVQSKYQTVKN